MSDINFATSTVERRQEYFKHSKHTNGFDFLTYRKKVMTEDEEKLGQKIIDNFEEAYRAKERAGVFKDMEIAEAYWSGDFENKTEDQLSNTNIINTNIETQVADLMDQSIDIQLRAYDPSDSPYISRARMIGDKILEVNKMPLKMQKITRRFKKFGHSWIRALFNPELLEGMGCPEIVSVSSADVYPDPAIINAEDINKGRFFIETIPATIHWAEQKFGMEKASAIYPGYKPYGDVRLNKMFGNDIDTSGERYLHLLYWCKYQDKNGKEKLRLIQCSGCGVILKDSMNFEKEKGIAVFPTTREVRYPYWEVCDMERENSIWGKSNASLLYPLQDVADELDNAILSNARLTGNPKKLITTSSGIDPEKIDNTEGQVIISNTADGYRNVDAPTMPQYIINRRDQIIQNERNIVSRVSDQQSGIKQYGVDTATESLALQQNAMKSVDATKTVIQIILADVLMYCMELAIEYWNEPMFFGDDEKGFEYFSPHQLSQVPVMVPTDETYRKAFEAENPGKEIPEYMEKKTKAGKTVKRKLHVILSVSVGAGIPKNKAFIYNMLNELYAKKAMSLKTYREYLEEYMGIPFDEEEQMELIPQTPTGGSNNPIPTSNDVFKTGGVSPEALNRLEKQRGGIENVK